MTNLDKSQRLSKIAIEKGLTEWEELKTFVKNIPYGRNPSRVDFAQVLKNNKGTCSSKHALLAEIAKENKWHDIKLILCMYKMSQQNTPGIGKQLSNAGLEYIPEAHCYLMDNNENVDLTNPTSDIKRIEKDILEIKEIEPSQVGQYKVDFHQKFIAKWKEKEQIALSFNQLWEIREKCIEALSIVTDK